jgi:hypothetical protein
MTTAGITMVRDEADIIEHVIRHMATQVDFLFVADNRSVDGTTDILERLQDELRIPMSIQYDDEVGYEQSRKMTALARWAHAETGCDWVVPFDADEIWYAGPDTTLSRFLDQRRHLHVVEANLFDHVATALDDDTEANPIARLLWRRPYAAPLPKVAARFHDSMTIGMGNHDVSYSFTPRVSPHRFAIRHFPYRSPGQVIRKIRNGAEAYAATDLPEIYGAHWRGWGRVLDEHGEDAIVELFRKWHWRENPGLSHQIDDEVQPPLRFDPACDVTSTC